MEALPGIRKKASPSPQLNLVKTYCAAFLGDGHGVSTLSFLTAATVPVEGPISYPLFPDDPYMATNRRVTITLMREAPPVPPDFRYRRERGKNTR
jgi:hypothetical protein